MTSDLQASLERVLLVDAANVVGSRPNGWWRDRAGAARRLVEGMRSTPPAVLPRPVVVVLEGAARGGVDEGTSEGVSVVHAPGEGDDTLAEVAKRSDAPVVLVSADRELQRRIEDVGGEAVGPSHLLELLDD